MKSAGPVSPIRSPQQSRPVSPTSHRGEGTVVSGSDFVLSVLENDDLLKLARVAGLSDSLEARQEASVQVVDSTFTSGTRHVTTY